MKKKIVGIITAMTMLISAMPQIIVNAADDIAISNLSELESFRDNVNSGDTYEGKTVILAADIDMSDKYGEGKELWESIGTEEHPFNGSFTGTGHTINVCIDTGDVSDIIGGLFGYTDENAVISNLAVSGSVRVMGPIYMVWRGVPGYVGAIVGNNKGAIKNCCNTADVTYTGNNGFTGGIAGKTEGSIINCYNTGNIKIMSYSGSNISETEDTSLIQNCFYLSESEMSDGKGAHGKTAEEFASGEVAYMLNNQKSEGNLVWYQNIGEDNFPTLNNTHSAVLFDGEKYYNNEPVPINKINAYIGGFATLEKDITTRKITSYAELEIFAEETEATGLLTKYPSSFFEDKFLYVHYIERGSGTSSYKISSAGEAENQINIEIIKEYEGATDDIFYWFLYVEADRSLSEKNINVILKDMIASYQISYYQGRPKHEVDFIPEDNLKLDYIIITSLDELEERWQGEARVTKAYGETFFDERSLLIISWQEGQPIREHKVSDIIFSDNDGIDITFSSFFNDELGADIMTDYSAVVSIPKYYADSKVKIKVENDQTITYPYQISGLRITNAAGEEIEQVQKNTSFIVEADITKTEERNEKDYLFVAVYDTDGALISLDYVKAKFTVDSECSFGFSISPQEKSVGSVKAFVWNTFNSMEPLAQNKTLSLRE